MGLEKYHKKYHKKYYRYSPIFARLGLGVVFFIFGIMQLANPSGWAAFVPEFVAKYFDLISVIYFNGVFDLIIGGLLLAGAYVRITAAFGIIHLIITIIALGFNSTSIRDFGLLLALISVFFHGPDRLCCMNRPAKR